MKAFLLCAGFGTRLRPYTDTIAKPAIPFLGQALCTYALAEIEQIKNINEVIINTHHLPKSIYQAVDKLKPELQFTIQFSDEQPNILQSGGGLRRAKEWLKEEEHFIYSNGDPICFFDTIKNLNPVIEEHKNSKALATIVTCSLPGIGTDISAIWADKDNRVIKLMGTMPIDESQKQQVYPQHFTSYMILSRKIFDFIPNQEVSHIFKDALTPAINKGELVKTYYDKNALWLETGNKNDFLKAQEICIELLLKKPESPQQQALKQKLLRFQPELAKKEMTQWPEILLARDAVVF